MQASAQLREAFPALTPNTEHASILWRRRCRACERVTQAMAAALPAAGALEGAAFGVTHTSCAWVAQRPVMHPQSWTLDTSHICHHSIV